MTEAERVGQLLMIGLHGASLGAADMQAIDTAHIGSVWIFGNRTSGVASIASLARAVQARARTATHGVGFLFAADQEGGLVQRLAGPGFSTIPTARVQGTWSPAVLRTAAATWGRQLAAAGVNLDLAPVMDVVPPSMVATNEPIGQLQREFGTDPTTVAVHGDAVIAGMRSAGVATALKHFPGLGRVTANTDLSTGVVDHRTTPADPYLAPFASGIRAGARFVMVSLATYSRIDPDHLAAFSPTVIGLLRGELGFTGVVVSDSLTAAATSAIPVAERALDFVMAGGDLAIVDGDIVAGVMAAHLLEAAEHDTAVRERVDAAALRVLRAKEALGLLPCA
ncbi:MAG TPA: glycoside hydrolase family 3 N-terminal domain-containing protein [Candidatus Limnocylindrales bacterium]